MAGEEPFSSLDVLTAETLRTDLLDLWMERRLLIKSSIRTELPPFMSEDYAKETLKAVTSWAHYAELFTYDDETGTFAFEDADWPIGARRERNEQ